MSGHKVKDESFTVFLEPGAPVLHVPFAAFGIIKFDATQNRLFPSVGKGVIEIGFRVVQLDRRILLFHTRKI